MSATHEVFNQSTPYAGVNLWRANRALRDALAFLAPALPTERLDAIGALAGSAELQRHARLANVFAPQLKTHDRFGHRVDQVEFHPSYHALLGAALERGLHGTPWSLGPGAHLERAAGFMLFTEAEAAVLCPVSMSYAATPALRANPALATDWAPRLAATAYDPRFVPARDKSALTLGMAMTEKQGGSDVRANTSRAEPDGEDAWGRRFRLTGHKWFCSAPMSDAFLVLAQTAEGLSCLLLPRWLPDGTVNPIRVQRLKDKLGNRANASSEIEFDGAFGWLVGEPGRGVPQILAMGALTRVDCALGSAGLMRQALGIALHHCAARAAFGRRLLEQPAMRNVLADLAVESEAATALALRVAAAVDRSEHGDAGGVEAVLRRVVTPVAKFWICKRAIPFLGEAMECLGGGGYVEEGGEGVVARVYREVPVNSIWEGAGNIMALDLLRALRGRGVAEALAEELAPVRGAHRALDAAAERTLKTLHAGVDEAQARRLARELALVMQGALLRRHSSDAVFAAFCASRLDEGHDAFGLLPAGTDLDALVARAAPLAA